MNLKYFIIHKPFQVLSQFSPDENKKTLADFFNVPKNVYPLGRLDYDSEGLLILSNDRALNQQLLHPTNNHEREYWVQVEGQVEDDDLTNLMNGLTISIDSKPFVTKACKAFVLNEGINVAPRNPPIRSRINIPTTWISISLTEGKNRQVRKMTAAIGHPTLRLIRYRIEDITIDGLKPGEMIEFSKKSLYKKLFISP